MAEVYLEAELVMAVAAADLEHLYDELLKARDEANALRAAVLPKTAPKLESLLARLETLLQETEDALDVAEAEAALQEDEPLMSVEDFEASLER